MLAHKASQNPALHTGALVKLTTRMTHRDEDESPFARFIPTSMMAGIHAVSYNPHSDIYAYPNHFEEWVWETKPGVVEIRTFLDQIGINFDLYTTTWPQDVAGTEDVMRGWLVQHISHRAVLLWDGEFETVLLARLHWTGKFHLRSSESVQLTDGGCAHQDEVMTSKDGRILLRTACEDSEADAGHEESEVFEQKGHQQEPGEEDTETKELSWGPSCESDRVQHEATEVLVSSAAPRSEGHEEEDDSEHQVLEVDQHEAFLWNAMVETRQAYMAYVRGRDKERRWDA